MSIKKVGLSDPKSVLVGKLQGNALQARTIDPESRSFTEMMPPKKIAIYLPSLRGGGAERAMLLLAEGLLSLGFDVNLVVAKKEGPLVSAIPEGVRVFDFNQSKTSRSFFALIGYLREVKPYALYSTIAHANIVAILAGKLSFTTTRIIVRESNVPKTAPARSFAAKVVLRLIPRIYPMASAIIAVSEGVKEELVEMNSKLAQKTFVLQTPVLSSRVQTLIDQPVEHPWFKEAIPIVIAAGRLQEQKDFSTLIEAFSVVRKRQSVRLIILGEGPFREKLQTQISSLGSFKSDVDLPGFTANPYPWFKHSAVFVLSSKFEGMPNVLIQAMACATPVVSTDCKSGPRELLKDGLFGRLVPVGDVSAMAEAISESLLLPRNYESQRYVWDTYAVETAVRSYLQAVGVDSVD